MLNQPPAAARSNISSAWSRACKRREETLDAWQRLVPRLAPGCWCKSCGNLGIAARFVSGYLIQLVPDVKSARRPAGAAQDFTDLHAWAEVYLPGAGWIGLDPTSGLLAGEGHLPLAATPDPVSAAPITGAVDRCDVEFEFEMSVTRMHEDPRVTKPYTDEQWASDQALGHQVDDRLQAGDVRLTMGGEPTFVSIDDMEGDEWNTTAVGPDQTDAVSDQLIKRCKQRFAPGSLLHFGQGKWYPGESLPRWAYSAIGGATVNRFG